MGFSSEEKQKLLAIKHIGPKIVERLEQLGFTNLMELAAAQAPSVLQKMAQLAGSSCWHNNPRNLAAIACAIHLAQQKTHTLPESEFESMPENIE